MKTIVIPVEFIENKGGVPQSVISLVSGLARYNKFHIVVLCPRESEMSRYTFPKDVVVITSHASSWFISKKHFFKSLMVACDLFLKLRKHIKQNTLFLTNHSGSSYMVSLLPIIAKKEIYVSRGGNLESKGFGDSLLRYKIAHGKLTHAIAISEKQKRVLMNAGMSDNSISIIHNGLPFPKLSYGYRPLKKTGLWISTIGYVSGTKNQHIGVELVALLRKCGIDARFNIYGASCGDVEYEKMLNSMIVELNVSDYVYFRGFVQGESLFENTDILISFSNNEGFGRSLVEAMLRKIPVIAFRGAGGPVDITNNGVYGYLVDENIAGCYKTVIDEMLEKPDENELKVLAAFDYANTMFTDSVMVSNYMKLLDSIN